MSVVIRSATISDIPVIHQYIKDLAEFEKAPDEAVLTHLDLEQSFFWSITSSLLFA